MIIERSTKPEEWNSYIDTHPQASLYHHWAFKQTVEKTYRLRSFYYIAREHAEGNIVGVLPLFYVPSMLFGNSLVSLPFCDYGGIVADNEIAAQQLYDKAVDTSMELSCDFLEMRQTENLYFLDKEEKKNDMLAIQKEKVRMHLALPESDEALFKAFTAKLRAQIRRPQKEGCTLVSGGLELLSDFYQVFVYNMRDLGSPVHSPQMIRNFLTAYEGRAKIFLVYSKDNQPLACSVAAKSGTVLVNPWASSDRRFQRIAPNMLLYWGMIQYAIEQKCDYFDFGRSTEGEGTYRFKSQWGAKPQQLFWYYRHKKEAPLDDGSTDKKKELFVTWWRKLPLWATRIIGPRIRRQISL